MTEMLDTLNLLAASYRRVLQQNTDETASENRNQQLQSLDQILLAESFLRKGQLNQSIPHHAPQVAVIGPTQSGKSTLINVLLGEQHAGVSPLASFTAHAQGFLQPATHQAMQDLLDQFFLDYEKRPQQDLKSAPIQSYSIEEVLMEKALPLQDAVIWDTPDFDSISARGYGESVLRCCALADVIILIVSKDKYADQSVWVMLELLAPLKQPTIVCVNKLNPDTQEALSLAFAKQWQEYRNDQPLATFFLEYQTDKHSPWPRKKDRDNLFKSISKGLNSTERKNWEKHARTLINRDWATWITPIRREQQQLKQWNLFVESAVEDCLGRYRRDFLNHPQHYETFQRALIELLELLEVPALAKPLAVTRQVVTWPIKQLQKAWKKQQAPEAEEANQTQEIRILNQLLQHLLGQLAENIRRQRSSESRQQDWWQSLGEELHQKTGEITERFQQAIDNYEQKFEPEIEASANRLYQKLQEEPRLLNSLRATRAATDVGGLLITLKTGGIGLQDFILAPAMLSMSSYLAETAMSSKMKQEASRLKEKQFTMVSEQLFQSLLQATLQELPSSLDSQNRFNIEQDKLTTAENWLKNS